MCDQIFTRPSARSVSFSAWSGKFPTAKNHFSQICSTKTAVGHDNKAAFAMPRQRLTTRQLYEPYLRCFQFARGTEFTDAQLLEIRPNHVFRYMCLLTYGTEKPDDNARPTGRRSSGLDFIKKAISFFMPNQNAKWNVESQSGNPTMSVAVNNLVKQVKKAEVRK